MVVVLPFGALGEIHEVFIIQCLLNSFIKEFSDSGGPVMHGIIYYYIIKYNINYIIININILYIYINIVYYYYKMYYVQMIRVSTYFSCPERDIFLAGY